ncbi:MAG: DUF1080 domain-containing protein [Mariniphaga sp.]
MIRKFIFLFITLFFTINLQSGAQNNTAKKGASSTEKGSKWISLFNGKNLEGWIPKVTGYKAGENPHNGFRVEDGLLRVDYRDFRAFNGRFGHLFYKDKFSNYVLHMEYRFVGEVFADAPGYCLRNSGVMVHSQSAESMDETENWPVSVEIQLLGCTDKVKQTTANACTPGTTVFIKDNLTTEHCIKANSKYYNNNEWVKLDIIVNGDKSTYHVVNGDTVLVWSKAQVGGNLLPENYPVPVGTVLEDGYIALQAEGQPIDFRDIRIMLLDDNKIAKSDNKSNIQGAAKPPAPLTKVIDNFESYNSNSQLASAWKSSAKEGKATLSLEPKIKGGGNSGLKFGYTTTKSEDQSTSSISLAGKWDLTGCNGVRVFFQPDGSGREMTIQFNTSGKDGQNIQDLWDFDYLPEKGDTSPRLVLIPFSRLKHNTKKAVSPDVSRTFKSDFVIETTILIGGKDDKPGSGAYYFDEFAGCKIQF